MSPSPQRPTRRGYTSPLREQNAAATKERIVAAAEAMFREQPDALTIPALAARAGVSVATVNRNFPSRQALLEAVVGSLDARRGPMPKGEEFFSNPRRAARTFFRAFDGSLPPGSLGFTAGVMEVRRAVTIPRRRKEVEAHLDRELPGLPARERRVLSDLLVVLFSTATLEVFRMYLNASADVTADRIGYAVEALLEHARSSGAKRGRR